MMLLLVGALLPLLSSAVECSLQCAQNAPCVSGSTSFADHQLADGTVHDFHQETSRNNEYCSCPHGWTGLLCDVKFEGCDGSHTCYHGGNCIPGLQDSYGNEQLYCSCENAIDEAGNKYVGRFCEHANNDGSSGSECPNVEEGFCVNGGSCNPNFPSSGDKCNCPSGYEGPHCEYKVGTVPTCDLDCQNGGICSLGNKENLNDDGRYQFWDHEGPNHMYCECPEEYDGSRCEVKKEQCGDNHCFNGGRCVEREVDGDLLHHCDCSETNENGDISFAGRFCQYEATSYCTKTSGLQGHLFCVNGGSCKTDPYDGCNCPHGFTGFSCEYVTSAHSIQPGLDNDVEEADDDYQVGGEIDKGKSIVDIPEGEEPCNLECRNGGTCRNGFKETSTLDELGPSFSENHQDFQHCVCPDGFAGTQCQITIEMCPSNSHMCFHGGKCVEDEDLCDCSTASLDNVEAFGGRHCEHASTEICTQGNRSPGVPLSFCVNGASCVRKVSASEGHAGCTCREGWSGSHCELKEGLEYDDDDNFESAALQAKGRSKSHPLMVAVLFFSVLAIAVVGGFMYTQHRRRKEREDSSMSTSMRWESSYSDKPKPINIAPRRRSTLQEESGEKGDDVYMASVASPNRDPMATHLAPSINTQEQSKPDTTFEDGDTPKIYIGPPRDEDGHELHSVNII